MTSEDMSPLYLAKEGRLKKWIWKIFIGIGMIFLVNAIFGRYLVLPGYLSSLEQGRGTVETASQTIPLWKIIRYLVWAYSFKFGVFFAGMGVLLRTSMPAMRLRLFVGVGFIYLMLAYMPFPGPYSLFFGIGGGLITVLLVFIFMWWAGDRERLKDSEKTATDYRLIGYFFFAMATYNLCPLMGVKTFGLYPEKMIKFGLQTEAASYASHIMIELVLGWVFIFFSYWKRHRVPVSS
jgi:hypothetical protein